MLIVGLLRDFPLSQTFEHFVTKPWTSVEDWDFDAFVCSDAPTKFSPEKLAALKIVAEWSFSVDNVYATVSHMDGLPHTAKSFFKAGSYRQHARMHECAARVLSYASAHAKSYRWFVRIRPDTVLTYVLSNFYSNFWLIFGKL